MSALRSAGDVPLFVDHPAMGVYGMLAGWLAATQPPFLTLCTTRPFTDRLLPSVLMHMREHLAMYIGMALGNAVSIAIAVWLQHNANAWQPEAGRGARCFMLMSIGMVLGCIAVGEMATALPGVWATYTLLGAMLAGTLFACLAERLCREGISIARAAACDALARPAHGALAR